MKYKTFFILFFNLTFSFPLITIPFKRVFKYEKMTEENIMENLFYNDLEVNIEIGTPPKKYPLLIKLQEAATYLMSIESDIENIKKYNPKESRTYLSKNEKLFRYIKLHCFNAMYIKDTFFFGNERVKGELFYFILANNSTEKMKSSGEIGLKFYEFGVKEESTFLTQLFQKKLILYPLFLLQYNDSNKNEGNLIVGSYPHEHNDKMYKKEDFIYSFIGRPDNTKWSILITEVYSDYLLLDVNTEIQLFYEFGLIEGSERYYNTIYLKFFDDYLKKKICNKVMINNGSSYYYTECSNQFNYDDFPDIFFQSEGLNYTFNLTKDDLFMKYGNKIYFLIVFQLVPSNWGFGAIFFKKYQIYFDQEKKIYGLYKRKYNVTDTKNNKKLSFFTLSIILGVLLLLSVFIICYLYKIIKSKRKIRANELEDQYEYISQTNKSSVQTIN